MFATLSSMEGQLRDLLRQKILDAEATPPPAFTRRDVHVPKIPGKAVAVIGMRRSGKTTFLWQILSERLAAGMPREGILFFSFDDERLVELKAADLAILLEEYYRLHPEWRSGRRALFLLDEIQLVEGWERFARRILDTEAVDLVVSGSSARMLSREVASSMRGRAVEAVVFPFSFREFLRHRGTEIDDPDRATKAERSALRKELEIYLEVGGFPEVQGVPVRDRVDVLRGYVDVTLLRDVIERHQVSHPVALRYLARHLLAHAAGMLSVHRLYNDLRSQGLRIAKDSLHAYLGYLEDAFLVHSLWVSTDSERRRMSNPRKVYPGDPGLIPVFDRSGRMQPSKALKTAVCLEFLRQGAAVSYVRTGDGFEVDFLARWPEGDEELVQVSAEGGDAGTSDREVRALLAAAPEHPHAVCSLITLVPETFRQVPPNIRIHDATLWLLRRQRATSAVQAVTAPYNARGRMRSS